MAGMTTMFQHRVARVGHPESAPHHWRRSDVRLPNMGPVGQSGAPSPSQVQVADGPGPTRVCRLRMLSVAERTTSYDVIVQGSKARTHGALFQLARQRQRYVRVPRDIAGDARI